MSMIGLQITRKHKPAIMRGPYLKKVEKLQVLETFPLRYLMSCFCDKQGGGQNPYKISSFCIGKILQKALNEI